MKTLIAIIILSCSAVAQTGVNTIITNINKDTFCQGERVFVTISSNVNWNQTTQISIIDSNSNSPVIVKNYQTWIDSNYTLSFYNFGLIGNNVLVVQDMYSIKKNEIFSKICDAGIKEYKENEQLIKTEYYNLLGQPINAPDGITIRIRYYNNGCVTDKIII